MFEYKEKCNKEVREAIKKAGLRQSDVARWLGMQDSALSRSLRYEWTEKDKKAFLEKLKEVEGE